MAKPFFDVFPTLQLEGELKRILENAEITKLSANHEQTHIRIYLHANRLIEKPLIWKLEETM